MVNGNCVILLCDMVIVGKYLLQTLLSATLVCVFVCVCIWRGAI